MEHYVTLFDSLFLPQGIALHMSMERHAGSYNLWIVCMDDKAYDILQRIDLPNVRLLQLSTVETEDLKRVKPSRTKAEYCWTVTPFAPRFVFEADPSVKRVTYIDADMCLRKNPEPLFRELDESGKQILITDHAYAPEFDISAVCGQYCVQFMSFNRDGEIVRKWWEERCTEWCFNLIEDGKFGDQKYLDDWPERFAEHVHVLQHQEWMLAPWNAIRFPNSGAITYHFHGLRIVDDTTCVLGGYPLPLVVLEHVYQPYLTDLKAASVLLKSKGHATMPQQERVRSTMMVKIKELIGGLWGFKWRYAPVRTHRW